MTDEPDNSKPARHGTLGCVVVTLLLVPVLYVLSPAVVMLILESLPPSVAQSLYPIAETVLFPLEWCYKNIDWVKTAYDWLFKLVGVR